MYCNSKFSNNPYSICNLSKSQNCCCYTPQGLFLQTVNQQNKNIAGLSTIIFDTITLNTSSVFSYNTQTGIITFNKISLYIVDWSLNINGSTGSNTFAFKLIQSDNTILAQSVSSLNPPGELVGMGLFQIIKLGTTARLINASTDTLEYTSDPVQSCFRIFG